MEPPTQELGCTAPEQDKGTPGVTQTGATSCHQTPSTGQHLLHWDFSGKPKFNVCGCCLVNALGLWDILLDSVIFWHCGLQHFSRCL